MIFKCSCEFYIEAKNKEEATDLLIDNFAYGNPIEEHIIMEEGKLPEGQKEADIK